MTSRQVELLEDMLGEIRVTNIVNQGEDNNSNVDKVKKRSSDSVGGEDEGNVLLLKMNEEKMIMNHEKMNHSDMKMEDHSTMKMDKEDHSKMKKSVYEIVLE